MQSLSLFLAATQSHRKIASPGFQLPIPVVEKRGQSNTPLDCQDMSPSPALVVECGLDWVSLTKPLDTIQAIAAYPNESGGYIGRLNLDKKQVISRDGRVIVIYRDDLGGYLELEDNGKRQMARVTLPSKALSGFTSKEDLFLYLYRKWESGWRGLRVDLALDDYTGTLSNYREKMRAECKNHNYSGFRKYREIASGDSAESGEEKTLYLGRRKSRTFVRIYDKRRKVGDKEVSFCRFEREMTSGYASAAFNSLGEALQKGLTNLNLSIEISQWIKERLIGGIRFLSKTSTHLDRMQDFGWWSEFCDWVSKVRDVIKPEVPVRTLEKTEQWVEKNVTRSLAMLFHLHIENGIDWLLHLVEVGLQKMSSPDRAAVEAARVRAGLPDLWKRKEAGFPNLFDCFSLGQATM